MHVTRSSVLRFLFFALTLVCLPVLGLAGILEPGHTFFVELLRQVLDAFLDLFDGRLGNEPGDEA